MEPQDIVERLLAKQRRCKGKQQQGTWFLCADAMAEIKRHRAVGAASGEKAGRVERLENCLRRVDKFIDAVAPSKITKELDSIRKEVRASLSAVKYQVEE